MPDDERKLLDQIIETHKKPTLDYGSVHHYHEQVANKFNKVTPGPKKTARQICNYLNNQRRRARRERTRNLAIKPVRNSQSRRKKTSPNSSSSPSMTSSAQNDIVCGNIRSLGSPSRKSQTSSSSGYVASSTEPPNEEYRSLADDLPRSWEYTEIGNSLLNSPGRCATSSLDFEEETEPHIFDDIDDYPIAHGTLPDKSGMSQDLVNILADQARQHHRLKMKLVREKYRRMTEVYKTKMAMLEAELEMKKKQHEQKMENLMQEYKRIQDSLED